MFVYHVVYLARVEPFVAGHASRAGYAADPGPGDVVAQLGHAEQPGVHQAPAFKRWTDGRTGRQTDRQKRHVNMTHISLSAGEPLWKRSQRMQQHIQTQALVESLSRISSR